MIKPRHQFAAHAVRVHAAVAESIARRNGAGAEEHAAYRLCTAFLADFQHRTFVNGLPFRPTSMLQAQIFASAADGLPRTPTSRASILVVPARSRARTGGGGKCERP